MKKSNLMNLKIVFIIVGIICFIIAYAADYFMDEGVIKGIILIISSSSACFSFLKAMVCCDSEEYE